jgi:hypothetical protein
MARVPDAVPEVIQVFHQRHALAIMFLLCSGVGMPRDPVQWFDPNADNPPWVRALARHRATREGYCYQHVQAIIVAIDQYAETALGNREYFLNRPHGIG